MFRLEIDVRRFGKGTIHTPPVMIGQSFLSFFKAAKDESKEGAGQEQDS